MSFDLETLYKLLPAVYRINDYEQSENKLTFSDQAQNTGQDIIKAPIDAPLKAFLQVIAEQIAVLEENLAQLYDDQFIETCAEWAIPYNGDLVGYHTPQYTSSLSLRSEVANTVSYRRRKGTATLLEQLVRDVTNWNAHIVEYFELIAATQHVNRPRPCNRLVDLRQRNELEELGTPFEHIVHTVDIRNITAGRYTTGDMRTVVDQPARFPTGDRRNLIAGVGRYNIPGIGIFLWRLCAYSLTGVPAVQAAGSDGYHYFLNPLGSNLPLFRWPVIAEDVTQLAGPLAVAMPISRCRLARWLPQFYGTNNSLVLTIKDGHGLGKDKVIMPDPDIPNQQLSDLIMVSDLSDSKDAEGNTLTDNEGNPLWSNMSEDKIAIDPLLGRVAFPRNKPAPAPGTVYSSFCYGFSIDMGGGEYHRADSFTEGLEATQLIQIPVEPPEPYLLIQEALDALLKDGVVEINDNGSYAGRITIHTRVNQRIELRAADFQRPLLKPEGERGIPIVDITGEEGSQVTLNGLVISDGFLRVHGKLNRLTLRHCTLVPGLSLSGDGTPQYPSHPSLIVESADTLVEIDKCIIGGLHVVEGAKVSITNSIVDATKKDGVAYAGYNGLLGGSLSIKNSTIVGTVQTAALELASNTIFLARAGARPAPTQQGIAPVFVQRRHEGCVRFSYLPVGAKTPRRYHCLPENESDAEQLDLQFTSLRYGEAGYCQLNQRTAIEIRTGADDKAEMGAFHDLYQPQREANLCTRLDEYLRFGFETGIFYMT